MKIQSDGSTYENDFVMATMCNGKWEGGSFLVAPDAVLNDGQLNVLVIKKIPILLLITYLLRFRWGPAKWMTGIKTFRATRVELLSSAPVTVHRDGEHLGTNIRYLKFSVEKNSLMVMTPKGY